MVTSERFGCFRRITDDCESAVDDNSSDQSADSSCESLDPRRSRHPDREPTGAHPESPDNSGAVLGSLLPALLRVVKLVGT